MDAASADPIWSGAALSAKRSPNSPYIDIGLSSAVKRLRIYSPNKCQSNTPYNRATIAKRRLRFNNTSYNTPPRYQPRTSPSRLPTVDTVELLKLIGVDSPCTPSRNQHPTSPNCLPIADTVELLKLVGGDTPCTSPLVQRKIPAHEKTIYDSGHSTSPRRKLSSPASAGQHTPIRSSQRLLARSAAIRPLSPRAKLKPAQKGKVLRVNSASPRFRRRGEKKFYHASVSGRGCHAERQLEFFTPTAASTENSRSPATSSKLELPLPTTPVAYHRARRRHHLDRQSTPSCWAELQSTSFYIKKIVLFREIDHSDFHLLNDRTAEG